MARPSLSLASWRVRSGVDAKLDAGTNAGLAERKHKVTLVDPLEYNLPMLDKMYKELSDPPAKLAKLHDIFNSADAFVVVTGEYNHTMPPALTNLMDYFQSEYLWKPSGIIKTACRSS